MKLEECWIAASFLNFHLFHEIYSLKCGVNTDFINLITINCSIKITTVRVPKTIETALNTTRLSKFTFFAADGLPDGQPQAVSGGDHKANTIEYPVTDVERAAHGLPAHCYTFDLIWIMFQNPNF